MPTPVRLHRLTRRGTAARVLAIASLLAMACTDGTSNDPAPKVPPAPPADPTLLVIALPAGVEVGVDDQKPEAPPLAPLPLEPGTHTLHLVTACQQLELPVELAAGTTTRIDPARAKGLELATLEVVVRDLDGKPLTHTVSIGDTVVGAGQGSSKVTVPACQSRVKVASEGLGGFIEDVNFDEQSEVRREVVLAPGPDMVRIHGGAFTLGPPEGMKARWTDEEGELMFPQFPVEVEAFDLDRTEVTAAQWQECRAAASPQRCYSESDCEHAGGCPKRVYLVTHFSRDKELTLCNADVVDVERPVEPDRKHHPMNCVARWEAEDYCRWVGKRLPSAVEWEYAARGGDDRNLWPWGNDEIHCARGALESIEVYAKRTITLPCGQKSTSPVGSFPAGDSRQGVSDLVGNVSEYVGRAELPGTDRRSHAYATMGSSWRLYYQEPFRDGGFFERHSQDADVGFRCARTVRELERGDQ